MSYGPLITEDQLRQCMPGCKEPKVWADLLDVQLFEAGIVPLQIFQEVILIILLY